MRKLIGIICIVLGIIICYDFYINHNGTNELTMDSCTLLDNNNNM